MLLSSLHNLNFYPQSYAAPSMYFSYYIHENADEIHKIYMYARYVFMAQGSVTTAASSMAVQESLAN